MKRISLFALFLYVNLANAQIDSTKLLTQDDITLGYDNKATPYNYRVLKIKVNKNKKQLIFLDKFDDSISIYLNDKLITSRMFKTSVMGDVTVVNIHVKNNKFNLIKITLHNNKKYIEFPLDKRYPFVELYYQRDDINDSDFWNVYFTDNMNYLEE